MTVVAPTPAAAPPAGVSLAVLRKVGLRPTDLPAGYAGNVVVGGDEVTGQVTLDMCGVKFASEALRTARHQIAFQATSSKLLPVSNEVVAYSGKGAALAMAEVRHAATHCPKSLVASTVASMPPTVQRVVLLPAAKGLPTSSLRLALIATEPKSGKSIAEEMVFTVRGHVLSGVYVNGAGAAAATAALRMAKIVAARLQKLVPAK